MQEGQDLRKAGRFPEAVKTFLRVAEEARRRGDAALEARALVASAACEIRLFRYAAALEDASRAREISLTIRDFTRAGAAAGNISSIYSQLGDFQTAAQFADESVTLLRQSPEKAYYGNALINQGDIRFGSGKDAEGSAAFEQAIALGREATLPNIQAAASDDLGIWLVIRGDLGRAETYLNVALHIRENLHDTENLAKSYEHLAELETKRGPRFLHSALAHINQAFATPSYDFKASPQYYPLHIRAGILRDLGETDSALAEARRAVEDADLWRQSALPGDTTSTRTVGMLHETYQDFAELAAEQSLKQGRPNLGREAWEVLARNRAASLREQLTRAYRHKLIASQEYFPLLLKLQDAQAAATLGSDQKAVETLAQLREQLSTIENKIGIQSQNLSAIRERNPHRNSLRDIQSKLGTGDALLSFSLGDRKSFLWAITKDAFKMYQLPAESAISNMLPKSGRDELSAFQLAGNPQLASTLSRALFGQLEAPVRTKPNWLITADRVLLDRVPFSMLPVGRDGVGIRPLALDHNLRFLPSELLLSTASTPIRPTNRFIGVGDPIYNRADPRLDRTRPVRAQASKGPMLARLVGSRQEIENSAKAMEVPEVELLTGANASDTKVRLAIQKPPEYLHFAVHVISPAGRPAEAALALSLTTNGIPELLTAESIATYRVPGSLVVLSGCSTQQGSPVPGAGLMGLSRAWLLAGADAVVVSAWPTPDDSGQFFSTFYKHYRDARGSVAQRASVALQETQIDMQHSNASRKDARFWAAYSIVSKE